VHLSPSCVGRRTVHVLREDPTSDAVVLCGEEAAGVVEEAISCKIREETGFIVKVNIKGEVWRRGSLTNGFRCSMVVWLVVTRYK